MVDTGTDEGRASLFWAGLERLLLSEIDREEFQLIWWTGWSQSALPCCIPTGMLHLIIGSAIISLSNFPESLLNPLKELYLYFTGVTIGFFNLDDDFRPWRHVESTKQGEFLFSCIHFATVDPLLTTGSIHTRGIWKYRRRGTISTGFRHCR
jgi:hypothetical protein